MTRDPRHEVKTTPRARPRNVTREIVREREFRTITLEEEHVAEFPYSPTACKKTYRMVVLRKRLRIEKGHISGPELDGRTTLDDLGFAGSGDLRGFGQGIGVDQGDAGDPVRRDCQ